MLFAPSPSLPAPFLLSSNITLRSTVHHESDAPRHPRSRRPCCLTLRQASLGKGQMGSALVYGVAANCTCFDRTFFCVLPLTCLYLPKSARAYLFPQSVKLVTLPAAPLVLTPFVHNQQTLFAAARSASLLHSTAHV